MIRIEETTQAGIIRRTYSMQGELQCQMTNTLWEDNDPEFLFIVENNLLVPFRVTDWREKNAECLIFKLKGIDTEEQAARYAGLEIRMITPRNDDKNEDILFTFSDLIGYKVITDKRREIGTIDHVDESTANVFANTDTGYLFPLHEDLIKEIDTKQKTLVVSDGVII